MRRRALFGGREEAAGRGLMGYVNGDNRCYAAAALQMITMLPVLHFKPEGPLPDTLQALRALYRERWADRPSPPAGDAQVDSVLKLMPHVKRQEDAHEFTQRVFSYLCDVGGAKQIARLMHGEVATVTTCQGGCGTRSTKTDIFGEIQVDLLGGRVKTLKDHFDTSFHSAVTLRGDEAYECDACKCKTTAVQRKYIQKFPKFMMFTIARFRPSGNAFVKDTSPIQFEHSFEVDDQTGSGIRRYVLISVVHHRGSLGGGHYYTYCRVAKQWYKMDDDCITAEDDGYPSGETPYMLLYQLEPLRATAPDADGASSSKPAKRSKCFPE